MMARPLLLRLIVLAALSATWLILTCAPALAHARLVQADPADGTTLEPAPEQVQLRFNEPVEAEFTPVRVYDRQGERVDQDNARTEPGDARVLTTDLEELSEGSYTVEWRVTSVDGHIIEGEYGFTVAAGGSQDAAQTGDGGAGETQPAPTADAEQAAQQDAGGGGVPILVYAVVGLGALALLGLALLRRQ